MQEKKPKAKKGLWILTSAIVAYIFIGGGVLLYDVLTEDQPIREVNSVISDKIELGLDRDTALPLYSAEEIEEMDDETFAREYEKYLNSSFADVPARPLEDEDQPKEEVYIISKQIQSKEEPKGFFARIIESVFGEEGEVREVEPKNEAAREMLSELDGEIKEMQTHFSLYKDGNGVAYIDHLNKPENLESNGFYIYIGVQPNGFTFHRTIIRYSGEEEIELKRVLIQTSQSDRALIIEGTDGLLQRKVTTSVNEWLDLPPTQDNIKMLNTVTNSEGVKVTFMGALKNVVWELSEDEVTTLKESLYFYKLLKEKEELSK